MFWQKYLELCNQVGLSPNELAAEIGVKSSGSVTGWKNGSKPRQTVIMDLCKKFDLPTDYFDDNSDAPQSGSVVLRQELRDSYASRILFDAASDATDADMLEAAALIMRRKEERNNGGNT